MIISVLGAKGSAVTTTTLALAASWPSARPIVLELDPTGGDLAAWFDLPVAPGVVTAAAGARTPNDLVTHTIPLPGGVAVIAAPVRAAEAAGPMAELGRSLLPLARHSDQVTIFADLGTAFTAATTAVLASTNLAVLVVRQDARARGMTVGRCVHSAALADAILAIGVPAVVVVVGARPFAPTDIAAQVGLELAGVIADDPVAAARLAGEPGSKRASSRSRLLRGAAVVSADLFGRLATRPMYSPASVS